ncbi:MAG TPA: maleylpyruvate isomerase family mycothiol-dependent enzyme [Streptosporangiaceae bacterium]|nr:maleylpyruvate isomerase family mycothiol-dependent enzyme [Streptosporangiaceae bacterium]
MSDDPRTWIATLRESHDRLAGLVQPMDPDQIRAQSYDRDWSNAQVLSHLGSGAEIALLGLPGALGEGEPVGRDAFQPVWDVWDAKTPDAQAADAIDTDERHVATLEGLTDEQLAAIQMEFFGMQLDAVGMVRLRLGEHVLHTWDLAVMQDPVATVQADAVGLLIDNVPQFLAPRLGKPLPEPFAVRITTTDPARDYLLTSGESISMADWPGDLPEADADAVPQVTMPAEALLRLSYGRLDPEHTPASVQGDADTLDKLRAIFPGF